MASPSELEDLIEGQVVEKVPLTQAQAAALNTTRLVSLQPTSQGWTVTAAYAVGTLRCGDLTVRVRPKVGAVQVLRLLARAQGVRHLKLDAALVDVERDRDLTSVLATLFAAEAATAMTNGPLRGYRSEDQTLSVLRGRVRVRDQELRRFGQLVPIEVSVDEWTTDTDDNRRLRAAVRRLLIVSDLLEVTRRRLIRLDRELADVTVMPTGAPIAAWTPTRLNVALQPLLYLADLVLAHGAVEHRSGDVHVRGFVLSMATLFERLITRLMIEASPPRCVLAQHRYQLDRGGIFTIVPDLVFQHGKLTVAVADLKYKLLDDQGDFPNADAYQLIAYCTRIGLSTGHLIYAAGDPRPGPIRILGSDVTLVIHAIDLTRPLAEIERHVQGVLQAIAPASRI